MREIKFRGYDRKTGDMFPIHEMEWCKTNNELHFFRGFYDWEKDGWTVAGGSSNKMTGTANHEDGLVKRFELMQYTGLKDKNGREIYEGDIVNVNHYGGTKRLETVQIYTTGGFADIHPFQGDGYHWSASKCEVIGNIYENPELLEQQS